MSKPFVVLQIAENTLMLRYGTNQIVALEQLLGVSASKFATLDLGFTEMRAMLWAGLQHSGNGMDKRPSIEDCGELLDEAKDMTAVMQKVNEAMNAAFGNSGNAGKPKGAKARK